MYSQMGYPGQKENVAAGIVGAFLFSLVGGVLWFALYQVGYMASFSGFVGVVCAIKGYRWLAKKESVKGVVIAAVVALLVLVLAWYCCLAKDVYTEFYQPMYESFSAMGYAVEEPSFFRSLLEAYTFLEDPEIAEGYFIDLGFGLAMGILGGAGSVVAAIKRAKAQSQPQPFYPAYGDPNAPYANPNVPYGDPNTPYGTVQPAQPVSPMPSPELMPTEVVAPSQPETEE